MTIASSHRITNGLVRITFACPEISIPMVPYHSSPAVWLSLHHCTATGNKQGATGGPQEGNIGGERINKTWNHTTQVFLVTCREHLRGQTTPRPGVQAARQGSSSNIKAALIWVRKCQQYWQILAQAPLNDSFNPAITCT